MAVSLHARGRALLIGIGDYPTESGWEKINASNDLKLLSKTLEGYQITTLQDSKATYNGIKAAFKKFTAECQTGDTVIIHFSCHGQQMVQTVNSKDELDYLDEAIVPFDALNKYSAKYRGEHHLKDDELSQYIDQIRIVIGDTGFVLVSLDACHSDNSDRGSSEVSHRPVYRGSSDIFGKDVDKAKYLSAKFLSDSSPVHKTANMSNVLYISACKAYQRNSEVMVNGIGYGSLTISFCESFQSNGISDMHIFLSNVKRKMSRLVPAQNIGIRSSFSL